MGEHTKIEWTDSTFSPWWGCTKIAPACDNCYAAALDKRTGGNHWGNEPRRRTSEKNWNEPRRWQRKADAFFAEHGRRRRVFCASMADVFDNQVPASWRADLWELILECPDLDWLLLTKRPQNIENMKPAFWDDVKDHVWLGATVEDQEHADQNIPHLLQNDSAVRFVSCEPLLGPIYLAEHMPFGADMRSGLNWVIAGGESGAGARPSHPNWFRLLREQCDNCAVPFLFKQWGDWKPLADDEMVLGEETTILPDGRVREWQPDYPASRLIHPDMRRIYRPGKKAAGRLLDGVTHDGFPVVA